MKKPAQLARRWITTGTTNFTGEADGGPLKGLRVLDLTRVLAGPFCTQILADYGADVIKVEAIGKGDDTRHWMMNGEPAKWKKEAGPMSNYFSSVNRNKRSITLDMKHPKGQEVILKLVKKADVIVENFKPGTMDRLGLGYEALKKHNSRLIYASISGYGTTGPFASRGGYDPIAGAEAGLIHVTGERNGAPVRPGIGVVDMATGLYLHGAILAALQARERRGIGQRVDASLFEAQISMLTNVGLAWLNLGIEAERWGCQHPSIAPYDAFKTKDSYLVCGATNDAQYASLCKLLGLDDLVQDQRFSTNPKRVKNRHILTPIFNNAFSHKTTAEWLDLFSTTDLPRAPINNMEHTFAHPQALARGMVAQIKTTAAESGEISVIGPAVKFSETKPSFRSPPPRLGQDTEDVLVELGIDAAETSKLRQQGAV
ncbi:CoA-transferase family III domain-containing protein [Dactylonectria macrodidyma]|uniref:CoA-transferase family III domain-containing protein n=1 Tax=Dactylonectria macrodidyma TaxID=307937 RepID=A0A9P9ERJ4_9HYPO|nr:CoA-transferase family III domain-containing protein [Dactylonectria macrodidyma]